MQPIPEDILVQFNAVLEQKAVSATLRDDYRKLLRYYLDFLVKYPPSDAKSDLSDKDVQEPLYKAVRKARLTQRVTSHTFRHSFATHLLQANYDIRTIREMLGHADVRTTMICTHCAPSRTMKERKSPLDF